MLPRRGAGNAPTNPEDQLQQEATAAGPSNLQPRPTGRPVESTESDTLEPDQRTDVEPTVPTMEVPTDFMVQVQAMIARIGQLEEEGREARATSKRRRANTAVDDDVDNPAGP